MCSILHLGDSSFLDAAIRIQQRDAYSLDKFYEIREVSLFIAANKNVEHIRATLEQFGYPLTRRRIHMKPAARMIQKERTRLTISCSIFKHCLCPRNKTHLSEFTTGRCEIHNASNRKRVRDSQKRPTAQSTLTQIYPVTPVPRTPRVVSLPPPKRQTQLTLTQMLPLQKQAAVGHPHCKGKVQPICKGQVQLTLTQMFRD